jgi:hypothetical protein
MKSAGKRFRDLLWEESGACRGDRSGDEAYEYEAYEYEAYEYEAYEYGAHEPELEPWLRLRSLTRPRPSDVER